MNKDNNLLDFLKKRSLFQHPPSKNMVRKVSRAKSREGQEEINSIIDELKQSPRKKAVTNARFLSNNEEQYKKEDYFLDTRDTIGLNTMFAHNDRPITKTESKLMLDDVKEQKRIYKTQNFNFQSNKVSGGNTWTGFGSYPSSFESARVESLQCLDSLSLKLGTEITNINHRIDNFSSEISKTLASELKRLKETILNMVNDAFGQTEKMLASYLRSEQQKVAGEALKVRQLLEREYINVENMKDEIQTSQWRRVAGQVLSSDLENKINDLVRRADRIQFGRLEVRDFQGQSLANLKTQLKKLTALQRISSFR